MDQPGDGVLDAPAGPSDRVSDRYQAYDPQKQPASASDAGLGWFANRAGSILSALTPDFGEASKTGLAAYADFLDGRDSEGRPYSDMPLFSLTEPSRLGGLASFMAPYLLPSIPRIVEGVSRAPARSDTAPAAIGGEQATTGADTAVTKASEIAPDAINLRRETGERELPTTQPEGRGDVAANEAGDLPETPGRQISKFFQNVRADPGRLNWIDIGPVANADRIRQEAGLDVEGYARSIDNSAVNHVWDSHMQDPVAEARRGNLSLEAADWESIPEVINHPDEIRATRTNSGLDGIVSSKRINGYIVYVEELRTGRRKLALTTMWKRPATTSDAG